MVHLTAASVAGLATSIFQTDAINTGNAKTLEVFVGVVAFCFLIIMIVAVVLLFVVLKAKSEIMSHVNEIKGKVMPIVDQSSVLIKDLTPQIKEITAKVNLITGKVHDISGHVEEIVIVAKDKAHEWSPTITQANETVKTALNTAKDTFADANQTVQGVNSRTRVQVDRVNGMISDALDATTRMGKAIEYGITQPGREVAGIVAGVKATVTSLASQYGGVGGQLAERFSSLFQKRAGSSRPAARSTYTQPGRSTGMVRPFGSMAERQTERNTDAGVSSSSTGNRNPIL